MSDVKEFPYETFLNVLFEPLQLVDVPSLASKRSTGWYNQTLCRVNDSVVRLGVHDNDAEFFFVLSGRFAIDLEDRSIELEPEQGFVVPKGVVHRTRAPERAVILMVETATVAPTGDV